ncbi:ABC transporter permease [Sediminispirochaeta smaragdinae]|uniref:Binding-protein-dependent transport systems inner membrane component n=1 Tax=Sediminispirochaeta smaragdinae (strain DSM 11293 / JCM 15392 / SEBR 4228) TaxID=573413 RepID=E1R5C1_SEDSS|nr:ABC transporter permease subunit [Sediminispirochaeta smaragdinae]ADK82249.1 binding-protein-dependent transport systems inner membrane component [Sediminispirochaeta smaragdinae DSM 11293]
MKISPARSMVLVAASVVLLLIIWEAASSIVNADIILPTPFAVLRRLIAIGDRRTFFRHIAASGERVAVSFLFSLIVGILLGIGSGLSSAFRAFLSPFVHTMRTVPVMAVILIAILWFPSTVVPIFAAVLMALPVVIGAVERGILEIDSKLVEMAHIFRVPPVERLRRVIIPQLVPSILTAAHLTLGLCWKVVVAGEIFTIPRSGVGAQMQLAQLSLESEAVFAWTVVVVISAALSQALLSLADHFGKRSS